MQHQMAPPEGVRDLLVTSTMAINRYSSTRSHLLDTRDSIVKCTYSRAWSTCPTWSRGFSSLHGGLNMAKFM